MSSASEDESSAAIEDLKERGRETIRVAQEGAEDALSSVAGYIRENPWIAVGAAALVGGALAAICRQRPEPPGRMDAVREWLDEAYAKLPSQRQVQSAVDSSGVPDFLRQLKKKLNLG